MCCSYVGTDIVGFILEKLYLYWKHLSSVRYHSRHVAQNSSLLTLRSRLRSLKTFMHSLSLHVFTQVLQTAQQAVLHLPLLPLQNVETTLEVGMARARHTHSLLVNSCDIKCIHCIFHSEVWSVM